MRWKAYFFLNPNATTDNKDTFGFKSQKTPPYIPELTSFERKLRKLIFDIKFRKNKCHFQQQMFRGIDNNIKSCDQLLIAADKTTNYYKLTEQEYHTLLHKAITKDYKKVSKAELYIVMKKTSPPV